VTGTKTLRIAAAKECLMAKTNREREDRIQNEIIVDANGSEEQALAQYRSTF
jgi:hypothetical protein